MPCSQTGAAGGGAEERRHGGRSQRRPGQLAAGRTPAAAGARQEVGRGRSRTAHRLIGEFRAFSAGGGLGRGGGGVGGYAAAGADSELNLMFHKQRKQK